MSAQFDSTPGLHLPQPSMGGSQQPAQPMVQMPPQPQQQVFSAPQPMNPPMQANPMQYQQPAPQIQQPTMVSPQFGTPITTPVAQQPMTPAVAPQPQLAPQPMVQPEASDNEKDGDALDEEWVAKTKVLIEQYRNDPYALSNALSALKSDYMKARHGVVVKVSKPQ